MYDGVVHIHICTHTHTPTCSNAYCVPVLVRELSEEEKQMIILSGEFQRFLDRAGRLMERAVCESVDIYTDYTGITDGDEAV